MNKKSKGTNAERELIHMLWAEGFACMRAPSSGAIKYPCPDIIAGNLIRKLAIECKATRNAKQYLTKKEIGELKEFSLIFGTESWVGVRFDKSVDDNSWYFMNLEDLDKTEGENFVISLDSAKRKGLLFEELVEINK
ncbi:Holliday junction resolvase Hjc [Nanoarchaeota archaeon]